MAIYSLPPQQDLEKKFKILNRQLSGGSYSAPEYSTVSETTYLYADLKKIALLTVLILIIQIMLFYFLQNQPLNIKLW